MKIDEVPWWLQTPKFKTCAIEGCTNRFADHVWGARNAQKAGWFCQKDGTNFCPNHIPDWVAEWRNRSAGI